MQPEQNIQFNMLRKKRRGFLIPALFILALTSLILLVIFLFSHPTVYFSKNSGFTEHDAVKAGKNKLRFVVPETIDTTKSTFISIRKEWFTTSRLGTIVDIKAKPGKYLALDFTDRQHDSEVFTIYTKNWFGIKKQFDVIVDYSNFLRIFFPESHDGAIPRKPEILAYSKLQTDYKHKFEELYKIKSFYAYDKAGKIAPEPIHRRDVFSKDIAHGRAFIVNNSTQISLVYDFLLPGIFKNQAQKTQVYDLVDKTVGKAKTLDPEKQGHEIQFNTPPFYISKFLGWYYIDPTGNRVDLKPGEEFNIPTWVKSELRLIAKYDITADIDKLAPALDKQGLVAVSYFDGVQRVFLDIVKRGTPLREHIYNKDGYVYEGWYKDSGFTQKVDFSQEIATTHISLYLKSIPQNQPQPEKPTKYHTITFKTPDGASQLSPAKVARDQKLDANYAAPNRVSKVYPDGKLEELDYWTIWDPINNQDTGVKFDFNTPITSDLVLYAHLRPYKAPDSERPVTFKVLDHIQNQTLYDKTLTAVNNKIQDADKAEINGILGNAPADVETPMGTYRFKGWYLNGDINSPFNIDDTLPKNTKRFEIHAVYDFEPNDKVPNPQDPDNPLPLDPSLVKLTFLTPERTVLAVQTQEKGKAYLGTLPTISKLGYVFKHWAYFENSEVKGQFDTTAVLNENTVLYPVFEKDPNVNLENEELHTVKIYNPLLKSSQVLKVKKGELLGVDTNAYTTTIEDKEYVFDKFTYEDGSDFDHLTTQITKDLNLTVNLKEKALDGFKSIDAKISDPVQGKVLFDGKIRVKDGQIYAPDRAKLQAIFDTVGTDIESAMGKHQFKGWYLDGDTNSPFIVNDQIDPNTTRLDIQAVYDFEPNDKVPNPEDPDNPLPLDPSLVKLTFLTPERTVLAVQTQEKGKAYLGTLPTISKLGYIFKHWAYFENNEVKGQFDTTAVLNENTVLYPVFEKDPNANLENEELYTVKIYNPLLKSSQILKVKKGELLGVDTNSYTTTIEDKEYVFDKFTNKDGSVFDHLTTAVTQDLELTVNLKEQALAGFKLIDVKIIDPVQGKVLFDGKVRVKDNQIYAPDRVKLQAILDTVGADIDTVLGKYRFKGWYLNGDLNSPFTVNDNLDPNTTNLTVKAVYYFEDNNKVPNPDNPSDPKPLDPALIKVTFLSDSYSVISVQTSKKGKVFDGTLPNVEKRGYIFKHWVYFKSGVVGSIYNEQDVLTENTVLYPVFEKDPSEPEPKNTAKVTMQSDLLGQSEHRFVKKGTKLDLDPQQFNTKVGKYLYRFKRFIDENGNTFDYKTKPIIEDITLKIEYEKTEPKAKYTIKHVFEGVEGQIPETTQTVEKETTVGSEITVDSSDGLPGLDHGFDLVDSSETKTVKADGSTEFILNYKRKEFTVTYQANYQNHFPGTTVSNEPQTHKVKYQEKIKEPDPAPKLERHGRTYTFKHWQLESNMNGVYGEQSPYNFNTRVNRNVDLVAYFEEKIEKVNYKIVHMLEKQGESSALNGQYDRIEEVVQDQKVEDGATYRDYATLDSNLYEKDAAHPDNLLNSQLTVGDNTTEVRQYYKLKETTVNFRKTAGIQSFDSAETISVKKTRKIDLPNYNLKANYEFTGWSYSENGPAQTIFIARGDNIDIYANTKILQSRVKYTILTQRADGGYDTTYETKNALIGSVHTASYANPNSSIYQDPRFNPSSLTVSANENENQVTVTIDRNVYTVTFEVIGHSGTILNRVIRHGAKIGAIDESQFAADDLGINKAELDGNEKTKEEIENFLVQKNHKVTLHIGIPTRKFGKYPQTKVDNPAGIHHLKDEVHELKFNSKGNNYTIQFTRSYWQDSEGNRYEKFNNQYFKIEPVNFLKIPKQNTWFTEKIIDFSPFNIYYYDYSDNGKPERSIFKAMVEDIGKVLEGEVHMPTYDSGDFKVKPALDAGLNSKLKKEHTDYAKAVLYQFHGNVANYRGIDLSNFDNTKVGWPYYLANHENFWWLGTQHFTSIPSARFILSQGHLYQDGVHIVLGVVVCIR